MFWGQTLRQLGKKAVRRFKKRGWRSRRFGGERIYCKIVYTKSLDLAHTPTYAQPIYGDVKIGENGGG